MSGELVLHGDVEALAVDILTTATPELDAFAPTVSTDLRGYSAQDRWIKVTIEGGATAQWNVISKPRLDLEVRGERRDVAHDMGQICLGSLFRAVPHSAFGARLVEVKTELGLVNVPDREEEESYRYVASLRLTCTVDPHYGESS